MENEAKENEIKELFSFVTSLVPPDKVEAEWVRS
jgi:hypothetical protein